MLGKLAYRNTKRNIKDYLIYLITVTASFSLIFAFNLVTNSDEIVKLCSSMDAFKNSLFAVNILIIFVICFLINYTTKFMFEKRSKELGTYMLLGIKKKEIAHLVVIENILLGILAIVLAIPIGFLFSQFVSLVIVNLLGIPKTLFISLNFVSIGLLIIYFLTIYVLVLLNLLRRISKMTIRDFLYFDKQNEKKMFRDSKKRNVIFVLSIILGVISLFLWNSRCTMDNFNKQETLTCLMVSVIMLIISIYGISTTCADMFLTVLLKNKKMKYQNDNLFVARTFASKARTMSFTFGTLSMLILTSLLALNYSSINKASYDISVNLNAPYDIQLFDDKQVFDEYIRVIEEEYTIDNTIEYDIYKEPNHQVQKFFQSEYYDFDPVLKLSDYNRLLELRKMPLLSLNDNEYYIVTNSKFTILFIPIYFISFAHIGLLNTALFFVATFVFLKISTMENSATLFSAAFNDFLSSGANIHIHQSSLLLVLFPASLMNHIFAPINNQHSLFCLQSYFHQQKPFHNRHLLSLFYRQSNYLSNQAQFFLYTPHMT